MDKMEFLNSFLIDRLMAVAGEIFDVVKDTLLEYQAEVERCGRENRRLKKLLRDTASEDVQAGKTIRVDLESNQRSSDSDPLVTQVKLELVALERDDEPSTSSFLCARSDHDTHASHADGDELELQNDGQGPRNSGRSLIQEKPERSTVKGQKMETGNSCDPLKPCDSQTGHNNSMDSSTNPNHRLEDDLDMKSKQDICSNPHYVQKCNTLSGNTSEEHSQGHVTDACTGRIQSPLLLKEHLRTHHGATTYRCNVCGKCYGNTKSLKLHSKTHTERPFQCKSCEKTYKLKSHLKDHERTHTGDKPYSCSACGMRFIWTNQVKVHIRNYHRGQQATVVKEPRNKSL